MSTKATLKKDIVIPAGAVFNTAPTQVIRYDSGTLDAIVGLSKDTSGSFAYYVGEPGSEEREQLAELFAFEDTIDSGV